MRLSGKVALVTGAGSGIGRASAKLMAREGARIAALGHTEDELREAVEEIRQGGADAIALVADISDPDQMQDAVQQIIGKWGRLDIVFANAGINGVWAPIEDLEIEEWKNTLDINLTGTFLTIKCAVPHLRKQRGSIIVTSSVNGTRMFSNTGASAYATSKAGQVALVKMLAPELGPHGVRINVICPGAIETSIGDNTEQRNLDGAGLPVEFPEGEIPLGGEPGSSEQVAQLVLFLASEASSHITGTEVWIDGAQSLLQG
ncbi:MAG: SDR family oxidoreductase [Gemmatimonadetes bacterium]|nr:SDR family oxidoreductase [Gemmatimonadota bacterium]